jgi:hypothetical protein
MYPSRILVLVYWFTLVKRNSLVCVYISIFSNSTSDKLKKIRNITLLSNCVPLFKYTFLFFSYEFLDWGRKAVVTSCRSPPLLRPLFTVRPG